MTPPDQDLEDARRGFIAALDPGVVHDGTGAVVWDNDAYAFLGGDRPATVDPSLWRQAGLCAIQGLFEVTEGIYQVRGLDLSNMTLVEGAEGVIVIDPLISTETAAAALALYREHRGDRPVTAVIYTHSHVDHFGGVKGVTSEGGCPILAPQGFLGHAVAENVYAGTAMTRRAAYMYGTLLPKGPEGQVGCGLGQATSTGTVSLLAPTVEVTHTGQVEVLDGVRIEFQLTPGTEAPAEMNFLFPDHRALCAAENATHNLHNLVTLRGALVRDPHVWAHYLNEAVLRFGDRMDVVFASHHWPTWGREQAVEFLSLQRDLYAYLHDQALRLLNQGLVGAEIAEALELPPALADPWHLKGYYGSHSHNLKAVYQRYLGWFDGNPAHLWAHPPVPAAERYVEFMGGADAVVEKAQRSFDAGDLRWVAEVVNHVVFAAPDHAGARALLAETYRRLGHGAENATWRNFFLTGALELTDGVQPQPLRLAADVVGALTVEQVFDAMAVRIDGPRAADARLTIDWVVADDGLTHRTALGNGVLIHHDVDGSPPVPPDATFSLARADLLPLVVGLVSVDDLAAAGKLTVDGDATVLDRLRGHLDHFDPDFAIVTP